MYKGNSSSRSKHTFRKNNSYLGFSFRTTRWQRNSFYRTNTKNFCEIWPILQYFHCAYHLQSSGLAERANGIIKTELAELTENLNISWLKALPIVLMNLWSTPSGQHNLSPFEIITGRPMKLISCQKDSISVKGDVMQYCKTLRKDLKHNTKLVEKFFNNNKTRQTNELKTIWSTTQKLCTGKDN